MRAGSGAAAALFGFPDEVFDSSSPIYGMPILDVERAKTVLTIHECAFYKSSWRASFGEIREIRRMKLVEFSALHDRNWGEPCIASNDGPGCAAGIVSPYGMTAR